MSKEKTTKKLDWVHISITGKPELAQQIKTLLELVLSWLVLASKEYKDYAPFKELLKEAQQGKYLNNTNPLAFYLIDKGGHKLGEKAGFIIEQVEER